MMLTGVIRKSGFPGWYAGCDAVSVYTQGATRKEACASLADGVEAYVDKANFKVSVTETGNVDGEDVEVFIDSDRPEFLAAAVLRNQREMRKLSMADVAKKLGAASINAYAAYEQGTRAPSLAKFRELLAVVAPELALTVAKRKSSKRAVR
jgi:Helix-turn-helix